MAASDSKGDECNRKFDLTIFCACVSEKMLGYESENRLKNFLVALGDGEQGLEASRARLCRINDFAPNSAFQRFDRDGTRCVTSREIVNFLRDQRSFGIGDGEAHRLVRFFDSDGFGRLSF